VAEEVERFSLRHTCEECAHFDAATDRCRSGWPTEPYRRARYERDPEDLVLCKEFELA
jgi:hypothetical protein